MSDLETVVLSPAFTVTLLTCSFGTLEGIDDAEEGSSGSVVENSDITAVEDCVTGVRGVDATETGTEAGLSLVDAEVAEPGVERSVDMMLLVLTLLSPDVTTTG